MTRKYCIDDFIDEIRSLYRLLEKKQKRKLTALIGFKLDGISAIVGVGVFKFQKHYSNKEKKIPQIMSIPPPSTPPT